MVGTAVMLLVSLLFPSVAEHFFSGMRIMSVISSSWRSDWMSWERELVLEGVAAGGGSLASMDVMGGMEHSDSDSMMIMILPVVEVCRGVVFATIDAENHTQTQDLNSVS